MNYYTDSKINGIRRYRTNITGMIQGFSLEVTPSGTVYCDSNGGKQKLDSLLLKNGIVCCELPNGKSVELMNTENGLKQKAPGFAHKVLESA